MKRITAIIMLMAVILIGGMTIDAKTTKKNSSKSSSSATWNGDIPSPSIIVKLFDTNNGSQLEKHGYRFTDNSSDDMIDLSWTKSGVCKFNYTHGSEAGDDALEIDVYDSAKRNKLYKDLKKYLSNKKGYSVFQSGNQIYLNHDY